MFNTRSARTRCGGRDVEASDWIFGRFAYLGCEPRPGTLRDAQRDIVHDLPKRTRLRIPEMRGDVAYFEAARNKLRVVPGVSAVGTTPPTGSLVIEHAGDLGSIAAAAAAQGLFLVNGGQAAAPARVHPLSLASAAFAGLGLYQVTQGNITGSATDAVWNSYGAAVTLKQPLLSAALLGVALYGLLTGQVLSCAASLFFYSLSAEHMTRTPDRDAAG